MPHEIGSSRCSYHQQLHRVRQERYRAQHGDLLARKRQANASAEVERVMRWQQENPERLRETQRRYETSDQGKAIKRMISAARRARKLSQFIEDVDPTVVYEMHGGMCGICEEFIVGDFHVDHVIPLSKGGFHGYINCQPAHPTCNLVKGAS